MSSTITTRPATEADVSDIADRLSPPDLDALQSLFPASLADVVKPAVNRGECEVVCIDGRPEVLFGCASYPSRRTKGFPWFIASPEAFKSEARIAELVRLSQQVIGRWQERHAGLLAMNDARNASYADWLALLGFKVLCSLPTASGYAFNLHFLKGAV